MDDPDVTTEWLNQGEEEEEGGLLYDYASWLADTLAMLSEKHGTAAANVIRETAAYVDTFFPTEDVESLSQNVRVLDGALIPEVTGLEYTGDILDVSLGTLVWAVKNGEYEFMEDAWRVLQGSVAQQTHVAVSQLPSGKYLVVDGQTGSVLNINEVVLVRLSENENDEDWGSDAQIRKIAAERGIPLYIPVENE